METKVIFGQTPGIPRGFYHPAQEVWETALMGHNLLLASSLEEGYFTHNLLGY